MDFSAFTKKVETYLTPEKIYWSIIACLWIEYAFELYLCLRQRKVYHQSKEKVPKELNLDKETFEKSRLYGLDKGNFSMFHDFYSMFVLTGLLSCSGLYKGWIVSGPVLDFFNVWPVGWDKEIGKSVSFSLIALLFNNIVGLPLSLYSTFVLEEKHGFNKQTLGFFCKDTVKGILVSALITVPIVGLIVKIVQLGGQFFFVWLWIFCFIVLMFLMTIYPLLIAPLFDKYTPLQEGPLRTRIEALAGRIKFPLTKLFVVEGSKRSAHSNAYLYGLFNNKRIVLYDTLIKGYVKSTDDKKDKEENGESSKATEKKADPESEEKGCTDEEIEAVLGHELGHWKLNHVVKNIVISQANLLFIFALFAMFYQNSTVYEAFGFPKKTEKPILLGLIIVLQFLLQIYNAAMGFLMHVLSRKFEFEADEFSVQLGYGRDLKGALMKLNKDNLSFPITDPLYSAWHHSHPPLLQRLHAIDDAMKKSK
ncbi:CAAX prenyl protease 1 homolog [Folsomia candida]|uniref:CAAX prenyl protease n=1 Tax=Folsomia candida TaxID=158441 RepID=A0A226DYF1_FOLCA|nr:CAAX prenyl protease 1 homolog [Folsomia candida]OXA50048.1 CAAX prenyl protease 1 [Folsomia candida]